MLLSRWGRKIPWAIVKLSVFCFLRNPLEKCFSEMETFFLLSLICLILCRDRKRKKFVSTEVSRPKKIKTESGIYISASYKSNLYLFNFFWHFWTVYCFSGKLCSWYLFSSTINSSWSKIKWLTGHGMVEHGERTERDDVSENTNSTN